jgi:hypothetical protein
MAGREGDIFDSGLRGGKDAGFCSWWQVAASPHRLALMICSSQKQWSHNDLLFRGAERYSVKRN